MKKIIAFILVAIMAASLCATSFGAVCISFEDEKTYAVTNAASKYYRKCKVNLDTDNVKFGKYSGKVSTKPYYWSGDSEVAEGYVDEFYVRLKIKDLGVNDGDLVDLWFCLPEDCNIDTVNIKAYDQNEDEVLSVDTFTNDDETEWMSLSDYWGGSLDSQDNVDINTAWYICFYGKVQDPEKEAFFYVDNIFIGSESEHEQYVANPDAFVTVSADTKTGDAEPAETTDGQPDGGKETTPAADNGTGDKATDTTGAGSDGIIMWVAIGVAAVFAIAAVVVVLKKKK